MARRRSSRHECKAAENLRLMLNSMIFFSSSCATTRELAEDDPPPAGGVVSVWRLPRCRRLRSAIPTTRTSRNRDRSLDRLRRVHCSRQAPVYPKRAPVPARRATATLRAGRHRGASVAGGGGGHRRVRRTGAGEARAVRNRGRGRSPAGQRTAGRLARTARAGMERDARSSMSIPALSLPFSQNRGLVIFLAFAVAFTTLVAPG